MNKLNKLHPEQRRACALLLEGMTISEIAERLEKSSEAIETTLIRSAKTLGASSRLSMLALISRLALKEGFKSPSEFLSQSVSGFYCDCHQSNLHHDPSLRAKFRGIDIPVKMACVEVNKSQECVHCGYTAVYYDWGCERRT